MGAPVTEVQIVDITKLIEVEKNLDHMVTGTAHGALFVPNCFDSRDLLATSDEENRSRLAFLAILYGWTDANDRQFLFRNTPPRLVYSVDHGHFFPNSPNWTVQDLLESHHAQLDIFLSKECNFTPQEINQALDVLSHVKEAEIIDIVAFPPTDWGVTIDERIMMVEYLIKRQQSLLALR